MKHFWYLRPEEQHPPPTITSPHELQSMHRLSIACTQRRDLPESRQRALLREWCALLPTLKGVRLLWLTSRVPQALFDAACRVPGLEGLYVKWSGIKKLDALQHADSLRYLHLGSSPSVESIDPLAACGAVEWLGLENMKRIRDLSPIEGLSRLRGLSVEGSMWAAQHVRTLAPVGRLAGLEYLSIANLRADDETLRPLLTLRKLQAFHAAAWWDPHELDELRRLNPGLGEPS